MSCTDPVPLAQALIRHKSITPEDGGAQATLAAALADMGFSVTHLPFGTTKNLFARLGKAAPNLCFAGHTDVVPVGGAWAQDPFAGEVVDGMLYGRGACDMKGAIAAFAAACATYLQQEAEPNGSISFLITGDEEGPATDGTVRVLQHLQKLGQLPDLCLVGEPTNPSFLGEMIKIGRRGSLNASITVRGVQGHVAYPHRARNPVHELLDVLAALKGAVLDEGTEWFEPSSLQITSFDVGNAATNVIPAEASARLNIRFNDRHTGASLTAWLRAQVAAHADDADIAIAVGGEAFRTEAGAFTDKIRAAIERVTGHAPRLDTGGGTSDARFIARHMPVCEFGLVGATMHQIDECVSIADLRRLADIYLEILREFLS